jgi:Fe-S-cluster containining protein
MNSGRSNVRKEDGEERWARRTRGGALTVPLICDMLTLQRLRKCLGEKRREEESCYEKRRKYCDHFTQWRRKQGITQYMLPRLLLPFINRLKYYAHQMTSFLDKRVHMFYNGEKLI